MLAEVIASTNRARDEEFLAGLATEGFLERFLAKNALDSVATDVRSRLGNTTHISVMDAEGACASVTCSNGSCSGVVVPGTGMHLNNMLGEQDLNPLGFHQHPPGARVPSMMAPTVVLREGRPEIAIGSAGSNRIRSAILQTVIGVVDHGLPAQEAVSAPRIHVEGRQVDAEPGVDEAALERLEERGLDGSPLEREEPVLRRGAGRGAPPRHGSPHRWRRPAPRRRRYGRRLAAQQPPPAALQRFTRPKPKLWSRPAGPRSSTAASRRLRMPLAVSVGNSCQSTPTTPEVCGVAIDVPDSSAYWPPGIVESTFTPGAATSTSAFAFENVARASLWSVAATETTSG